MPKKRVFSKQPLDFEQLIQRWQDKGLNVSDPAAAHHFLRDVGYYRITGYGLAFEQYEGNRRLGCFKPGTDFSQLVKAYELDHKLRGLLLSAIGQIEISIRSIISHKLSLRHNSAHWFNKKELFTDSERFNHKKLLQEIKRNTGKTADPDSDKENRREIFIQHYYKNYDTPDLPPSWMIAEVLSLGSWSIIYEHLSISADKKQISSQLDLSPDTLRSWLHCLSFIRNVCAHHGRLFERILPLPPKKDKKLPFTQPNYVFNFICIIWYFLRQIDPESSWFQELRVLLEESGLKQFFGVNAGVWELLN